MKWDLPGLPISALSSLPAAEDEVTQAERYLESDMEAGPLGPHE